MSLIRTLNNDSWSRSVAWSPDNTKIASASRGKIRVWDAETYELIRTFYKTGMRWSRLVNSIAWSPDGTKIVSGWEENNIIIWNVESYELIIT